MSLVHLRKKKSFHFSQQLHCNMFTELMVTLWALLGQLQKKLLDLFQHLLFVKVPHLKQPPGPLANYLPFVGSLSLFAVDPSYLMLAKISKKYDRIYRLQFAKTTFIVICDPVLLQETFAKPAVPDNETAPMEVLDHQGLIHDDAEFWKNEHDFVFRMLRDLGLPRAPEIKEFDRKADEAICAFLAELQSTDGRAIFVDEALCVTIVNIFYSMIVGQTFHREDRKLLSVIQSSHDHFRATEPISLANFIPFFARLPMNKKIIQDIEYSKGRFADFMQPIIQEHRERLEPIFPKDLIDAYLVQIGSGRKFFTEPHLYALLGDLLTAGLETTAATIHWILLALVKFPGIQQKIYDEVRDITKNERTPNLDDRANLPYLEATILEGCRFPTVLPYGVPHSTTVDTIIDGYDIPKEATVVGLFWKFNHDSKLWNNPSNFDPGNHFSNGSLVKHPLLMPFSVGRRIYASEIVAHDTIFLILANLLYKFVIFEDEEVPTPSMHESLGGMVRAPLPFKIRLAHRFPVEPS